MFCWANLDPHRSAVTTISPRAHTTDDRDKLLDQKSYPHPSAAPKHTFVCRMQLSCRQLEFAVRDDDIDSCTCVHRKRFQLHARALYASGPHPPALSTKTKSVRPWQAHRATLNQAF